jgi:ABC-type sugar transport system ATPase subunit
MNQSPAIEPNGVRSLTGAQRPPVVTMRKIVKDFPGVRALDSVDFKLTAGELRGLVGKNGAGKSTLVNVLTGVYPADGGEIVIGDVTYNSMNTALSTQLGIQCVHQHSQLVPSLSIAENIFCGDLPMNSLRLVDWSRVYQQAQERLLQLGLQIDVRRKVEGLSVAERQIIEIAKALFADAKVIILDEATAPLPKHEVQMLFSFVRRQQQRGVAFIYISHYLEEIFELCDSVTVIRDGRSIGDYLVASITQADLIRLISGVQLEQFSRTRHSVAGAADTQETVLELRDLQRPGAYQHVDLQLYRREIVGLTGLEGSGKDALARSLFGLEPLGQGEVLLDGKPYHANDPRQALSQGIAYLPRDRHGYGIVGIRSVRENVTLPILRRLRGRFGLLSGSKEQTLVQQLIDKLNVKTPSQDQPVEFLSGGNQQKVVFAKLTSVNPKVLLLDEPTQGVDVQAKLEILKIVDQLAQEGAAVIVIAEEIRELLDISDRILVMFQGRIVAEFQVGAPGATVEQILSAIEGTPVNL